ncbi:hypothetical protein ADICYQ_2330 [Cyclobacterium qasimii M12-11B]|uniref:Uncharacterized protein n=1 Tax=Cyclobacterium qasimii M12-11B TaxID=641524 RepID=S7WXE2_9BACT|nr:hypothetical protein ADICYQ_2330 [Cyclobacterium qasimii M12-11B]
MIAWKIAFQVDLGSEIAHNFDPKTHLESLKSIKFQNN